MDPSNSTSDDYVDLVDTDKRMVKTQATLYLAIAYVFICIVGLIGNGAVLCMIARSRHSQAITNIFIFNLALADLLYVLCLPAAIYQMLNGEWTLGHMMCKLYYTCDGVSKFASVMFLVILSFDRYAAVCHPIRCRMIRRANIAFTTTAIAWTIVIVGMIPVYLHATLLEVTDINDKGLITFQCVIYWASSATFSSSDTQSMINSEIEYDDGGNFTATQNETFDFTPIDRAPESDNTRRVFTVYLFTLSFLAPLALVWIFYTMILYRLRRQKRRMFNASKPDRPIVDNDHESEGSSARRRCSSMLQQQRPPSSQAHQRRNRSTRRVTIMVLSIVICYTVCWIPYWCVQITIEFFREAVAADFDLEIFTIVSYIAYGMQSVNSMLNPFLYAFGTRIHRRCLSRQLVGLFCNCCRWKLFTTETHSTIIPCPTRPNGRNLQAHQSMLLVSPQTMIERKTGSVPCCNHLTTSRHRSSLVNYDDTRKEYSSVATMKMDGDHTTHLTTGYLLCCYCEKSGAKMTVKPTLLGDDGYEETKN